MKHLLLILFAMAMSNFTYGQWAVDKGHSKVAFIVAHHGISEVDGFFKKYEATLSSSKDDLSDAVFEVTIDVSSINTELEMRDGHLKGEDIFNVAKYPNITFKSTKLKKKKKNMYIMEGNLTMKGVTKPIVLEVIINGPVDNPNPRNNNRQIGIKAIGKVKRSDFGVGTQLTSAFVSDEITLRITGEFNKPK